MKFKIKASILLILMIQCQTNDQGINDLPIEYMMRSGLIKQEEQSENGVELRIGTGREILQNNQEFQINIGQKDILIVTSDKMNWGVPCNSINSVSINTCSTNDEVEYNGAYKSSTFKYQNGKVHLNFHPDIPLNTTVDERIDVKVISAIKDWSLDHWFVLGLSPKSQIGDYFNRIYKSPFRMLLYFKNADPYHFKLESYFKLMPILNPVVEELTMVSTHDMEPDSDYWSVKGSLALTKGDWVIDQTKVCISSVSDNLIFFEDPATKCLIIQKMICGENIGSKCRKEIANMSLAPNITITLDQTTYSIGPYQYIYFKYNVMMCYFGSISKFLAEDCPADSKLGVGKGFLSYYYPVFNFETNGKRTIDFLKKHTVLNQNSNYLIKVLLLVIMAGVILILAQMYIKEIAKRNMLYGDDKEDSIDFK